jgi:prepilin signal peptidase PulO-like enzyme (type II secretory pathway)
VEVSSALGFVAVYEFVGIGSVGYFILLLALFCLFSAIFVIDLEKQIIPDSLVFACYILILFWFLFSGNGDFFKQVGSGYFAALFLLLLHLVTKGKGMGLGDVKLALVGGTVLGLSMSLVWLYLAFLTGSLVGIILILLRKASFGRPIAFGPFLIFAFWLTVFWGEYIVRLISQL